MLKSKHGEGRKDMCNVKWHSLRRGNLILMFLHTPLGVSCVSKSVVGLRLESKKSFLKKVPFNFSHHHLEFFCVFFVFHSPCFAAANMPKLLGNTEFRAGKIQGVFLALLDK